MIPNSDSTVPSATVNRKPFRTLALFVKRPVAGGVKTRLADSLGAEGAASLYAAFIHDLVLRFWQTADRRVLCYAPAEPDSEAYFRGLASQSYEIWPQPSVGLGERMAAFFSARLCVPNDRVVIIGSDSPTLPGAYVESAFDLLQEVDCVLGPATDGGYYLVGMRGKCLPIFDGIHWSTPQVLLQTVQRLTKLSARYALLPPWYDVDSAEGWEMLRGHVWGCHHAARTLESLSGVNLDATRKFMVGVPPPGGEITCFE